MTRRPDDADRRMFRHGLFWGAALFGAACWLLYPVITQQWHLL